MRTASRCARLLRSHQLPYGVRGSSQVAGPGFGAGRNSSQPHAPLWCSVQVLGTFITEWEGGAEACRRLFGTPADAEAAARQLAAVAAAHGFEGWVINIENEVSPGHVPNLLHFLRQGWVRRASPKRGIPAGSGGGSSGGSGGSGRAHAPREPHAAHANKPLHRQTQSVPWRVVRAGC